MEVAMTIRSEVAWRKAANCTLLGDRTMDENARRTLTIVRNSWIGVANESKVLGAIDTEAVLLIMDETMAVQSTTTPLTPN
jgi:hypothetical protein